MKNQNNYADIILESNAIFTSKIGEDEPFSGIVVIKDNKIIAVDQKQNITKWIGSKTKIYKLENKLICPGFVDNHVFFTGYVWSKAGVDLSNVHNSEEALLAIEEYAKNIPNSKTILGHCLNMNNWHEVEKGSAVLDKVFKDRPVIAFSKDRSECWLNTIANQKYGIEHDKCYAEACFKLFQELLKEENIVDEYNNFSKLLASRGVTSIKEIGFDDYYGFTDILEQMELKGELIHRINLVSQPVSNNANFEYGDTCSKRFQNSFIKFMGYNLMVDGEIASHEGELLKPYKDIPDSCGKYSPDYKTLEETVQAADKKGFRCALHAEGDAAVRKSIDIIERCRLINGKRDSRHAIIDLELVHPDDIVRMSNLGITAINYVQIMNCTSKYSDFYAQDLIGDDRINNYWPYKRMIDKGVNICCGTDLPLDIPNIPLSVYFVTSRRFPDGNPLTGFNKKQSMSKADILRAWTIGGQYANFSDDKLGTIEEGKLADITVLDNNIFDLSVDEIKDVKVCLTITDGKIVYNTLNKGK